MVALYVWQASKFDNIYDDTGNTIGIFTPDDQLILVDPFGDLDTVPRLGTRGHAWSWGTFSVSSPLTVAFTANMSEHAGGDNWEIAITSFDASADLNDQDDFVRTPSPNRGWQLLRDGALDWRVSTNAAPGQVTIEIGGAGTVTKDIRVGMVVDAEFGGGSDVPIPGLLQRFYKLINSGAVRNTFPDSVRNEATIVEPFTADPSWWSGSGGAAGMPRYHQKLIDEAGFSTTNEDSYTAWLTGEVHLPKNGEYRFRDAADDFTYLAIDTDRSGVAGDNPDEILVNDNAWVNIRGNRSGAGVVDGNASPEAFVEVTGGGGWYAIEFGMSEGGGGDRGVLIWDYDVASDTVGGASDFPFEGEGVAADNLVQNVMVPNSHLRTTTPDVLQSGVRELKVGDILAGNDVTLEFEVSSGLLESDRILVENRTPDLTTTRVDFTGAKIGVVGVDELIPGDRWLLVEADEIVGADQVEFVLADPNQWDTSMFATRGVVEYKGGAFVQGDCNGDGVVNAADLHCVSSLTERDVVLAAINSLPGDLDGNGDVAFPDFLVLSANFGQDLPSYTDGNIDLAGGVAVPDFLVLSSNFGNVPAAGATAAAVPEPSSLALLGLAGFLIHGVRRRR